MQNVVYTYLVKFLIIAGVLFLLALIGLIFVWGNEIPLFSLAYGISFIFTGSNFWVMDKLNVENHARFLKIFAGSFALRFALVLVALIIVLKTINNHQIFFTVSFIISYICHSVIEIIFLNRILQKDTQK